MSEKWGTCPSEGRLFYFLERVYGNGREYQRLTREISALMPNWAELYGWGGMTVSHIDEEVRRKFSVRV